jgi:hypothetical protein
MVVDGHEIATQITLLDAKLTQLAESPTENRLVIAQLKKERRESQEKAKQLAQVEAARRQRKRLCLWPDLGGPARIEVCAPGAGVGQESWVRAAGSLLLSD